MNFIRLLCSGAGTLNFNFNNPTVTALVRTPNPDPNLKLEPEEPRGGPSPSILATDSFEQLLITQQQQLLNECIKINLELLESKAPKKEEQPLLRKRIKKVNRCEHTDKKHYAKGLCNNCYHKFGRNKKPWNCEHEILYAAGMCQNCYINRYNRMRRDQVQKGNTAAEELEEEVSQNNEEAQKEQ